MERKGETYVGFEVIYANVDTLDHVQEIRLED